MPRSPIPRSEKGKKRVMLKNQPMIAKFAAGYSTIAGRGTEEKKSWARYTTGGEALVDVKPQHLFSNG
jgi:hypothetical protein